MKWSYYPQNKKIPNELLKIVLAFENNKNSISSELHTLKSDEVLSAVSTDLEKIGYVVEKSKRDEDKIKMPVLYGECGVHALNFEVDAFNTETKTVIEVEAGRAVTNYQFLKDFFEACCMVDADYLCIAVRAVYRSSNDYQKVCDFFKALCASDRFAFSLKGILIIGY